LTCPKKADILSLNEVRLGESMSTTRDSIRKALLELVARRDPTVFQDPDIFARKIQGIGKWPDLPEISALKAGLKERFPWELQKDPGRIVSQATADNLAALLQKKHSIDSETAFWAVETWGISLGLKTQIKKTAPTLPATDPDKTAGFKAPEQPEQPKQPEAAAPQPPASAQPMPQPPAPTPTEQPAFREPDTSSTRLGVIFGSDEAGLIRVYKSWFDNAPESESARLTATTVKIQPAKAVPLFTAPPKTRSRKTKPVSSPRKGSEQSDSNAPRMEKDTIAKTVARGAVSQEKPAKPKPVPPVTDNEADSLLARANALLPGGSGRLDIREALGLLQIAVKKGSLKARRRFGEIYLKGIGVNPNLPNAASWFKTAAELGDAESQFQLGSLYACGVGVEYNAELAQKWLQEAVDQGHKGAEDLLKQISTA